jgi:hypothetical protein
LRDERDCAPVLDSHQCNVGAWIDNEAQARFGLRAEFNYLVSVHRDLHSLGQTAVSLHAKGESEAALALLPKIQRLRDLVLTELNVLIEEKGVS